MKNLLLTLVLATSALSANAFSNGSYVDSLKKQSFEELRQNWDVDFENDQVWFGGKIISILDTCMADETTIRTNSKVTIEEMDGDDFVVVGRDYLYKSIHTQRVVVDGDDTVWEDYTMNTTRSIRIVENDDDFEGDVLFERDYTIPACQ